MSPCSAWRKVRPFACQAVLGCLEEENPCLLSYRFGAKEGLALASGIKELQQLLL